MTDILIDQINAFDQYMKTLFTGKFYGMAELVNGQGEMYPVTVHAAKRDRISPADTWQLQTHHRVLTANKVPNAELFGRSKEYLIQMRLVVIANPNMGEGFILRFIDKFPDQVVTPGGYSIVEDILQASFDHPAIAQAEFGSAWEDKHRLTKNFWAINYTLRLNTSCEVTA